MRAAFALLLLLVSPATAAVQLNASSATVPVGGDTATVCVALATGGAEVAGTQNDLVWDGTCATLPDESSCYASGTHRKSLQGKLLDNRDFSYRALILSLSDVDPIDDGVLSCCDFVVEAAPGTCCPVDVVSAGASDSKGNAVIAYGNRAKVCTAANGARPSPTPTPTQCSSGCGGGGSDEDDGCQVAAPSRGGGAAIWPLAIAAIILALRRRS
jgi:MYXO-CTERM domain-containing protein